MKAVILAAGLGNRLLPYTDELPKCLLNVGKYTILEYQVAALKRCNISEAIIVVGHCGSKIRKALDSKVTIIENKMYKSTNSSYSLWMARDHIKDGFIYINSDLIFDYRLLELLLESPNKDATIIDEMSGVDNDMFKAQIEGERIICMDKKLRKELATAAVVGPVKFSKEGASLVIQRLEELVRGKEYKQWCYEIFNSVAQSHPLYGIKNPGYFWAEIDLPRDLIEANQNIPADFLIPECHHNL